MHRKCAQMSQHHTDKQTQHYESSPYHLVRITVWHPSSGPWSSPRRDLMDWWCCAPSLVPPSLQKGDATGELLSLVEYRPRVLHSRLPSTVVKEGEKKEKERPVSSQFPARSVAHSSLCLLGGAASGASAESSQARTAQAASSGL